MKQKIPFAPSTIRPVRPAASLVLAASLLVATGCATIVSGTRQKVYVLSNPPGATASVGTQKVPTPGVLHLPHRSKEIGILLEKPGYGTCRVSLRRKQGSWTFLNLLGIPAGAAAKAEANKYGGCRQFGIRYQEHSESH
jgi:hypothetical protein